MARKGINDYFGHAESVKPAQKTTTRANAEKEPSKLTQWFGRPAKQETATPATQTKAPAQTDKEPAKQKKATPATQAEKEPAKGKQKKAAATSTETALAKEKKTVPAA